MENRLQGSRWRLLEPGSAAQELVMTAMWNCAREGTQETALEPRG